MTKTALLCSLAAAFASLAVVACDRTAYPPKDPEMARKNAAAADAARGPGGAPKEKLQLTDAEWKAKLTPEQYRIMREKGTERAFTGKYWKNNDDGTYRCAACGAVLFTSKHKFQSECGWPAFDQESSNGAIDRHHDVSYGMDRVEVTCARCGAHLGHVFDDGPTETGERYCINSVSIDLETPADEAKREEAEKKAAAEKAAKPADTPAKPTEASAKPGETSSKPDAAPAPTPAAGTTGPSSASKDGPR